MPEWKKAQEFAGQTGIGPGTIFWEGLELRKGTWLPVLRRGMKHFWEGRHIFWGPLEAGAPLKRRPTAEGWYLCTKPNGELEAVRLVKTQGLGMMVLADPDVNWWDGLCWGQAVTLKYHTSRARKRTWYGPFIPPELPQDDSAAKKEEADAKG